MRRIDWTKEGRRLARDYAELLAGALVTALGFCYFFLFHDIAPGGVTGIATVLSAATGLGVGLLSFLINLPLFLIGWRRVGPRFAARSFVAMSALSFFIDLIPIRELTGNIMLAAVFGGMLMGIGLGMVVRAGATTGGTDMVAGILHDFLPSFSIPMILLVIDGMVILVAALYFSVEAGLYALLACFVSSKAMDTVIKGVNTAMQFTIITAEKEKIVNRILYDMNRGCTDISATGTYSGKPVGMLLCVVPRLEAARLKKIVAEVDPDAFVTVCDVNEVVGEGFTSERTGG